MNSRNNSEKDSKHKGWGRRDNHQSRFKKDFSGQDFYNQDWKNKNKKQNESNSQSNDKNYNIQENYQMLMSPEFKWVNFCLLKNMEN